jgi:hypothetical protein
MLAIVITLGGYYAGLNWLIRPPDPWQSNAKILPATAQHAAARKRPPVVKPAETANTEWMIPAETKVVASAEPEARLASAETLAPIALRDNETARVVEPAAVQARPPSAARAELEAAHVTRRTASATKARPANKRVARNTDRKLQLMVLRTYERSDGMRFTRLLPLSSARNAMAFYGDDPW